MARDPNPEFNSMPEMVVDSVDYNLFYKPDRQAVSPGLVQLSKSLESLVPTLTNYAITEDIKDKKKEEAKAIKDFQINKKAFAELVKNKEIPEGANPYYFNKMMSLDLNQKARKFKLEFDTFAANNSLHQRITGDAWGQEYETQLKAFYEKEGLDKYDPTALSNSFFNITSNFRSEREQQHNAKRMAWIQKTTEDGQIKNYTGLFIESQMDKSSLEDLFKSIKLETQSMIDLGVDKTKANDLFLKGFEGYLNSIGDAEGYDYARQILNGMKDLKLGTGFFAGDKGSRRNETIRADLLKKLNASELEFLTNSKKKFTINEDIRKQNLSQDFFNAFNEETFDLSEFVNQTTETEDGDTISKYSNQDKVFLRGLKIALDKTLVVTTSDTNALIELNELEENNPYFVKDKAIQLAGDGLLSQSDLKYYFNSTNRKQISEKNQFFILSSPYQNYQKMFKEKALAAYPKFAVELPLMYNKFQADMIDWHTENKDNPEFEGKPRAYQKAFDAEVKLIMGELLADSRFIQSTYDTIGKQISERYGIFIEDKRKGN